METQDTPQPFKIRNSLFIGSCTAVVLIAYFLLMRALGLADHLELRLLNLFIMFGGVIWSVRRYSKKTEHKYNWFNTLANGCFTVVTALAIFCMFMYLYLSFDPGMMQILHDHAWFGAFLTPAMAAWGVFAEGIASGFILAYITLSYINDRRTGNSQTTPTTHVPSEKLKQGTGHL